MQEDLPKALTSAISLHEKADKYAHEIQEESDRERGISVSRDALDNLHLDAVRIHKAIVCLALNGWASVATILLRTLLDGVAGALAIVNSKTPELNGFKYFCSYLRVPSEAPMSESVKLQRRETLSEMLSRLPEEVRGEARDFSNSELGGSFWYSAEFSGPTVIFDEFWPDGTRLYRILSGAAHHGFVLPYMFIEDWDRRDPGPRKEPRPIARSLLSSAVLLTYHSLVRAEFENLSQESGLEIIELAKELRAEINTN